MEKLTLEMALLILDHFDTIALTDAQGKYIYKNKSWINRRIANNQDVNVKYPQEIYSDTKVPWVIKTHQPYIGHNVTLGDNREFCNYYPVMKDGEFFGVLIHTFISGLDTAAKFSEQVTKLKRELAEAKAQISKLSNASYSISNIIGESPSIVRLKEEITGVARTGSTVLIEGETGVGKELVAHAIHDMSSRSASRFVRVNCAAIPPELMESEFFGYEEGAFSGARKGGKIGKFELASGGSIFLDEINQLPLPMQPKFLRVLQEREIEQIGGKDPIQINVRVIAAANSSLEEMVNQGTFREDLYYRLNVINIRVPPLRERKDDIPSLVRNLIAKLNYQLDMDISHVESNVMDMLLAYDWPGNIRELQNVLEGAMNRAHEETLEMKHFEQFARKVPEGFWTSSSFVNKDSLKDTRSKAERQAIIEALKKCDGNKATAAELLGIARSSFYKKLEKYHLE